MLLDVLDWVKSKSRYLAGKWKVQELKNKVAVLVWDLPLCCMMTAL